MAVLTRQGLMLVGKIMAVLTRQGLMLVVNNNGSAHPAESGGQK
ncbi:hypothetical protein SAMN05421840_11624 [Shewanella morhuae]|nr:hypothetical protein [Shewanella morhuae]SIR33361.1 hypothetical protein SAMN05421840_11624 [Shewanella morhuae]